MTIEELPDYPAIEQVNKALWRSGRTRGAAVLIGAGFSRNAERIHEGAPLPPDWRALTTALQIKLGYDLEEIKDPLRIAEEFIASLGRGALDNVIKELVPDDQWLPGTLHKKLVALNWVDILTTNWDTLLERAGDFNLGQSYDTVRCLEDLATTRAPRIVKLHGSLPANRPFILSEEDYRTYPKRFAPFVNLVQQVLLENELCLLGFSGDDPNFLEWTGWIRDHLGVSARRVYLVGVLSLRPAQRRLLEQRNISPVDLAPLVAEVEEARQHHVAMELLLDHFGTHKPPSAWEWKAGDAGAYPRSNPFPTSVELAERFNKVPDEWSAARREYPGWAVCPSGLRDELKHHTFEWLQQGSIIEAAVPLLRGQFAYEATWRAETALLPIAGYEELLGKIVEEESCWSNPSQRDFVSGALLRSARERRDSDSFQLWASKLAGRKDQSADASSELAYQHALWARDGLDFFELESRASLVEGRDPLWKLRKAALYAELGETEVARNLATEALSESRTQYLRDRDSIWALSRFAWARNLAPQYRDWQEMFKAEADEMDASSLNRLLHETKCDPWDWLSAIDEQITKALERLQELAPGMEPRFDAGTYRNRGHVLHFGQWVGQSLYDCFRLASAIGIPARTNSNKFLSDRMERADPLGEDSEDGDFLRILWTVQSDGEGTLERHFSRLAVAKLSDDRVNWLLARLSSALAFGLEKLKLRQNWGDQFWSRRCSHYAEMISRLVVRIKEPRATELLLDACAYGRDARWHSREMFDSLEHLIERSLSAVPPREQEQFLCELLSFPVPDEIGLAEHLQDDWPEVSPWLKGRVLTLPSDLDRFNKRVEELTHLVRIGTPQSRAQAANRLVRLQIAELLSPTQLQEFSDALWNRRSVETQFPADTLLYPHVFLDIPYPADVDPSNAIKEQRCIGRYSDHMITLANASKLNKMRKLPPRLLFKKEEALDVLRTLLDWEPATIPRHDLNGVAEENRRTAQAIGTVIAEQILPTLVVGDLDVPMVGKILERARGQAGLAPTLPELLRIAPAFEVPAIQRILDAMLSGESDSAWCGFNAIYRWFRGWQSGALSPLPRKLIDGLLWIIDTRAEPGRLHALVDARHMVAAPGAFQGDDYERLNHALTLMYEETAYDIATYSANLTLLRSSCVRLASAMKEAGQVLSGVEPWLALVDSDRLPEVRYALQTEVE